MNRARQRSTVDSSTPRSAATCLFVPPSAQASTILALRVPKTCATWAKALQSALERSACAGPVLARPEVG